MSDVLLGIGIVVAGIVGVFVFVLILMIATGIAIRVSDGLIDRWGWFK